MGGGIYIIFVMTHTKCGYYFIRTSRYKYIIYYVFFIVVTCKPPNTILNVSVYWILESGIR